MWDYRARLLEVIDGDTMRFLIDNGLGSRQEETVRLKGVWAPEKNQAGSIETAAHIGMLIATLTESLLWPFYIVTEKNAALEPTEKRTFTRYVGTVYFVHRGRYVASEATCLNAMIAAFLATHPEFPAGIGG